MRVSTGLALSLALVGALIAAPKAAPAQTTASPAVKAIDQAGETAAPEGQVTAPR